MPGASTYGTDTLDPTDFILGTNAAGAVKRFAGSEFGSSLVFNAQDYGWLPDGTDYSTEALALLDAVVAAGGGTIFFPQCAHSNFVGSVSGTTLTVTSMISGVIALEQVLSSPGFTTGLRVSAFLTGTGGTGTYTISASDSLSSSIIWGYSAYRADSQLFIPNDGDTIPAQVNIRMTGAGGGPVWGNVARDQHGASILDLRYTVGSPWDGNAKIESRGSGSLQIDNLTIGDWGSANNTPFIHSTNTTLSIWGNTFHGSGHADQDAIFLGGLTFTSAGNAVNSWFQGYGTVIRENHFRLLNRGVYGGCVTNGVVVQNNSWLASVGTRAIEFYAETGDPPDVIEGLVITGNVIEMADPMVYGVVLRGVRKSFLYNSFHDAGGTYVSDYYLVKASAAGGGSFRNTIVSTLSGGQILTQSGDATQLGLTTILGATSEANQFGDGVTGSQFGSGIEVPGPTFNTSYDAAGQLNVRSSGNTGELLCIGVGGSSDSLRYIDGWSSGGFFRPLVLQPRGGPVRVTRRLEILPTALTLSNGLNSDKSLWATDTTTKSSIIRVTGPTAGFSIGGFHTDSGSSTSPGTLLTIYNSTAQQMTIVNEDASSTAANRIKTLTGADVVLRSGTSSATFFYDDTDTRWILVSTN